MSPVAERLIRAIRSTPPSHFGQLRALWGRPAETDETLTFAGALLAAWARTCAEGSLLTTFRYKFDLPVRWWCRAGRLDAGLRRGTCAEGSLLRTFAYVFEISVRGAALGAGVRAGTCAEGSLLRAFAYVFEFSFGATTRAPPWVSACSRKR